ncbi:hypothetical protein QBC34DRAFT_220090 [Podospora aff. communis PSN243]|uniref:Uncharacterized protein n=1 Tax=Podospora aff. communis PSN243 TaxID=3040156 RepID=A0AAV9H0T8_9PEZI|nr:hypothetical protein QBC34DRAFT_220090 [Podospora aff. communis PSN243]
MSVPAAATRRSQPRTHSCNGTFASYDTLGAHDVCDRAVRTWQLCPYYANAVLWAVTQSGGPRRGSIRSLTAAMCWGVTLPAIDASPDRMLSVTISTQACVTQRDSWKERDGVDRSWRCRVPSVLQPAPFNTLATHSTRSLHREERCEGAPKEERERHPPVSHRWNGAAQGRQTEPRRCGTGYRDGRTRRRRHGTRAPGHQGFGKYAANSPCQMRQSTKKQKRRLFLVSKPACPIGPWKAPIAVNSAALFGAGCRGLGAQSPGGARDSWLVRAGRWFGAVTSPPGRCLGTLWGPVSGGPCP